jgi:NAD(P)-dependent dehydrogenase (short-subunit alcohol dehydrogenase family)
MRLQDRIALLTAAGSGVGRASALRFAAEGAHVVVTDLDPAAAAATVAAIEAGGTGSAEAHGLDVADRAATGRLLEAVGSRHGHLDVLFANAGIPGPAGVALEDGEWEQTVAVNLRSVFHAAEFGLPLLRRAEPGRASFICTASVAGIVGSPVGILYSATKGAVIMFVKSLALALGPEGIRVNALCPGSTQTPMLTRFFERGDAEAPEPEVLEGFVADTVPMGRTARPEEIAAGALYLASDDSAFVHGTTLVVDGGYLAK